MKTTIAPLLVRAFYALLCATFVLIGLTPRLALAQTASPTTSMVDTRALHFRDYGLAANDALLTPAARAHIASGWMKPALSTLMDPVRYGLIAASDRAHFIAPLDILCANRANGSLRLLCRMDTDGQHKIVRITEHACATHASLMSLLPRDCSQPYVTTIEGKTVFVPQARRRATPIVVNTSDMNFAVSGDAGPETAPPPTVTPTPSPTESPRSPNNNARAPVRSPETLPAAPDPPLLAENKRLQRLADHLGYAIILICVLVIAGAIYLIWRNRRQQRLFAQQRQAPITMDRADEERPQISITEEQTLALQKENSSLNASYVSLTQEKAQLHEREEEAQRQLVQARETFEFERKRADDNAEEISVLKRQQHATTKENDRLQKAHEKVSQTLNEKERQFNGSEVRARSLQNSLDQREREARATEATHADQLKSLSLSLKQATDRKVALEEANRRLEAELMQARTTQPFMTVVHHPATIQPSSERNGERHTLVGIGNEGLESQHRELGDDPNDFTTRRMSPEQVEKARQDAHPSRPPPKETDRFEAPRSEDMPPEAMDEVDASLNLTFMQGAHPLLPNEDVATAVMQPLRRTDTAGVTAPHEACPIAVKIVDDERTRSEILRGKTRQMPAAMQDHHIAKSLEDGVPPDAASDESDPHGVSSMNRRAGLNEHLSIVDGDEEAALPAVHQSHHLN